MTMRRTLARLWRRLRRPTFLRLAVASLAFHLGALLLVAWLTGSELAPPKAPPEPLVVELPAAEPGRPLVHPEPAPAPTPAPAPRRSAPPAVAARPVPPAPAPAAPPPSPAPPPQPEPPLPAAPAPVPPPAVARAPEPPTAPAPPPPPAPEPAPAPSPPAAIARVPEPAPLAPAPPAPAAPASPLPVVPAPAAPASPTPPRPSSPGPVAPSAPAAPATGSATAPAVPSGPSGSEENPFAGRAFSLLRPQLVVPPLPRPLPGGGGTRSEGEGAGESGRAHEGQAAIPLNNPPDFDHAEYFQKVKKAIEDHWSYPTEAVRKNQSGQLVLEFVIHKDGRVFVELARTSGIDVLDRYAINAVRLSAPFPRLPDPLGDSLRISASFTYILDHGFHVFGLK